MAGVFLALRRFYARQDIPDLRQQVLVLRLAGALERVLKNLLGFGGLFFICEH